jgi:hypothetical protein
MAPLCLFPYDKQVLVIHTPFPLNLLVIWPLFIDGNLEGILIWRHKIPIDNWTVSKVEFYSSNLSSVLAMDCFLEDVINYFKSLHQTYKSLLHRFCNPTNGSLLPNIQLVLGILHPWISFLSY